MKMGICKKSLHLKVFYLLILVSIFVTIVTYNFWPHRRIYTDSRLQDYYDETMKKWKNKRYLPWKELVNYELSHKKRKGTRYVLIWTTAANEPFNNMAYGATIFVDKFCPHSNCYVTDNVNYFELETEFDAILFGAEVIKLTDNLLPEQRLPYQKYVFVNTGSEQETTVCTEKFDSYFNWTWTYRLDSDIRSGLVVRDINETIVAPKNEVHWIPKQHSYIVPHDLSDIIEKKTKAVAWIAWNCNSYSYREKIALTLREELKKHLLTLDIYGKCGELHCGYEHTCNKIIETDYFFYLAFEDSLQKDYVTVEVLRALRNNAVPIVYGGANYTRILPPESYIDANNLTVPKLAGIMNRLMRVRKDSYAQYFWWKQYYNFYKTSESVDTDEHCELCRLLNSEKFTEKSLYTNFKEWWNKPDEMCLNWYSKW